MKILHAFADRGVESEALSRYGRVVRFTLDPVPHPDVDETVQVDLMAGKPTVGQQFDLGLFHPKCTRWARTTSISGDPADHEDQIPRARELAEEWCDHYIIENRPEAPLEDPTVLNGKMFGLPIHYERAFETSFPFCPQVRERGLPTECSPYFLADRSKEWWASVKGYRLEHPKEHLAKNALPSIYVHTLVRHYLKAVNERDAQPAENNSGRAPRKVATDQMELTQL